MSASGDESSSSPPPSSTSDSQEEPVALATVRGYEGEPLAQANMAADEPVDEDMIAPATLEQRFENTIPVGDW